MSQFQVYLQLCQSWIHPLGPGVSPPVTWSTLERQTNEEAHVGNFGRYRCQMDIFVKIVAIEVSVWLERHLWLSSDSNLRNSIRRSQKKNVFQFTGRLKGKKVPESQVCYRNCKWFIIRFNILHLLKIFFFNKENVCDNVPHWQCFCGSLNPSKIS